MSMCKFSIYTPVIFVYTAVFVQVCQVCLTKLNQERAAESERDTGERVKGGSERAEVQQLVNLTDTVKQPPRE